MIDNEWLAYYIHLIATRSTAVGYQVRECWKLCNTVCEDDASRYLKEAFSNGEGRLEHTCGDPHCFNPAHLQIGRSERIPYSPDDAILSDSLSSVDAAKIAGVTRCTVFNWMRAGKIHAEKIGAKERVSIFELSNLIKNKTPPKPIGIYLAHFIKFYINRGRPFREDPSICWEFFGNDQGTAELFIKQMLNAEEAVIHHRCNNPNCYNPGHLMIDNSDGEIIPASYITINEACEYAGVTRKTIYNWMKAGKLRARKFGIKERISLDEITALIAEKG